MIVTLQTERVQTLADVRAVIDGNDRLDYQFTDREAAYEFIRRTLVRFNYPTLSKPDKGVIGRYLAKMTGLSRAQMTRLVGQHRATGRVTERRSAPAHRRRRSALPDPTAPKPPAGARARRRADEGGYRPRAGRPQWSRPQGARAAAPGRLRRTGAGRTRRASARWDAQRASTARGPSALAHARRSGGQRRAQARRGREGRAGCVQGQS